MANAGGNAVSGANVRSYIIRGDAPVADYAPLLDGCSPDGGPNAGFLDEQVQGRHHDQRGRKHQQAYHRDGKPEKIDGGLGENVLGVDLETRSVDEHHRVLEEYRSAKS